MFFLRKSTFERLPVAMTGVRMGERALQLGIEDPSLVGAIAAKVGLSGHAVIVVRDEREAARARSAAEKAGALVDVQVRPNTDLMFESASFDVIVLHCGQWSTGLDSGCRGRCDVAGGTSCAPTRWPPGDRRGGCQTRGVGFSALETQPPRLCSCRREHEHNGVPRGACPRGTRGLPVQRGTQVADIPAVHNLGTNVGGSGKRPEFEGHVRQGSCLNGGVHANRCLPDRAALGRCGRNGRRPSSGDAPTSAAASN